MNDDQAPICRYYTSYSGVTLPLKLVNPLQPHELDNRNTYFRAHFDQQDRMRTCEKLVYGDVELRHRYRYHPDGTLREAEITNADGETDILSFDEQGNRIGE